MLPWLRKLLLLSALLFSSSFANAAPLPRLNLKYEAVTAIVERHMAQGFRARKHVDAFVDLKKFPDLKKVFDEVQERLLAAQKKVYESDPRNYPVRSSKMLLALYEDASPNAYFFADFPVIKRGFIFPIKDDYSVIFFKAMEKAKYANLFSCVGVSTGLIQKFLKNPDDLSLIAGVIAHELSHGIDLYSVKSLSRDQGLPSSQTQEFMADFAAMRIMSEAGFDPAGVVRGQKALGKLVNRDKDGSLVSVALNGVSTHPEQRLRESSSRLSTTLDRYSNGWNDPIPLKNSLSFKEVAALPARQGDTFSLDINESISDPQTLFKTFHEYFEFITNSHPGYSNSRINEENAVRFNFLIHEMTRLHSLGLLDTPGFHFEIIQIMAKILAADDGDILGSWRHDPKNSYDIPSILKEIPGPYFQNGQSRSNQHLENLEKNPFFNSAEYLQELFKQVELINPDHFKEAQDAGENVLQSLPSSQRLHYLKRIENYSRFFRIQYPEKQASRWAYSDPDDFEFESGVKKVKDSLFILEAFDLLPDQDKLEFFNFLMETGAMIRPLDFAKVFLNLKANELGAVLAWSNAKWGDQSPVVNSEEFKSMARTLWKYRSEAAIAELFLSTDRRIRWEWVFDALKIQRKEGIRQLKESVSIFLKSDLYRKLLLDLKDDPFRKFLPGNMNNKGMIWVRKKRVWLDQEVLDLFDGGGVSGISVYESMQMRSTFKLRAYHLAPDLFRKGMKERLVFYIKNNPAKEMDGNFFKQLIERSIGDLIAKTDAKRDGQMQTSYRPHASDFKGTLSQAELVLFNEDVKLWQSLFYELEDASDILIEAMDLSSMSPTQKRDVLKELILLPTEKPNYSQNSVLVSSRADEVAKKLEQHDLQFSRFSYGSVDQYSMRVQFYKSSSNLILDAFKRANGNLAESEAILNSAWPISRERAKVNFSEAINLKNEIAKLIRESGFSVQQQLGLYAIITRDGGTEAVDQNLIEMAPKLDKADFTAFYQKSGMFFSDQSDQRWSEVWIDRHFIQEERINSGDLDLILEDLPKMMSVPSFKRDDLLEKILWKVPQPTTKQIAKLESLKTYRLDPMKNSIRANQASVFSAYVQGFKPVEIEAWIRHIQDKPGEAMSREMRSNLYQKLLNDASTLQRIKQIASAPVQFTASELAQKGIDLTDELLTSVRGDDRIPLIDFLIHSGKAPLSSNSGYEYDFASRFLGYASESKDMKFLRAFLESIPEHEVSVTLSYLSSKVAQGGNGLSISPLFEPFQTPGKKAAQAFATYKLGNPEQVKEAARFKSGARPMTYARFSEIIRSDLSKEEYERIAEIKLIGAASLKTVVQAKLKDGQEVVISAIDPRADAQNSSHLKFLKKFVSNLEKEGIHIEANLTRSILESMERQLKTEIDQIAEAKKLTDLQPAMKKLNEIYQREFDGWTIHTPQIVKGFSSHPYTLVMTKAPGVTFDQLSSADQKIVGEKVVLGRIGLVYQSGWIEGDPHVGNIIVDVQQKKIGFIDVGQSERILTSSFPTFLDDRTLIGLFFYAYVHKDAPLLASVIAKLSEQSRWSNSEKIRLSHELEKFFMRNNTDSVDVLIDLFKNITELGVSLPDKISVGLLKGFATLERENYVQAPMLESIMSQEIGQHFSKKLIPVFIEFYNAARIASPNQSRFGAFTSAYRRLKSLDQTQESQDCRTLLH